MAKQNAPFSINVGRGIKAKVWTNNGTYSDTWIDEMMAMAAETMYFKEKLYADPSFSHSDMLTGGYLRGRIEYYSQDSSYSIRNGHGLTYWDNLGDVEIVALSATGKWSRPDP